MSSGPSDRGVRLAMTVVEVVDVEDVHAVVRDGAARVLASHDMAWSDVTCVARVEPDEPRDGESWLMAMNATGMQAGVRPVSESRWAFGICRTGLHHGQSRTVHHINITERIGAA